MNGAWCFACECDVLYLWWLFLNWPRQMLIQCSGGLGKVMKLDGNHFRKRFSHKKSRLRTNFPFLLSFNNFPRTLYFPRFLIHVCMAYDWLLRFLQ